MLTPASAPEPDSRPDHPPDRPAEPPARPVPVPGPDLVPPYRRCGRCNRCHGGAGTRPEPGDCWADYLDAVAAALVRTRRASR
ncbi:hypothetical protein [Kitasatospora sp. NBC_01539]|uniref:hypothetical protein n=1 Tax=Kitasatospora sp. NBC_01539 TaxID=2903577 RepID=UPI00386027D4